MDAVTRADVWRTWVRLWACLGVAWSGLAQIDSMPRRLLQLGFNQPTEGQAPFSGYAFYYHNQPAFIRTNWTLRAAVAPVFADAELGVRGLLGPNTDVGFGLAGGGFADRHSEIRGGRWIQEESFNGHAGEFSLGVYHLLNPRPGLPEPVRISEVPLQLVLRGAMRYSLFERDDRTASDFILPEDRPVGHVRLGIRWGGREPLMEPPLAFELSAWYEGQFRGQADAYGFNGSVPAEQQSHLFWARALAAYTLKSQQRFEFSITTGTSANADRLSAYRLGGTLPLAAEFPLMMPGYYFEELTVRSFVLANGSYSVPVYRRWELIGFGAAGVVDYLPGLSQSGEFHAGLGAGVGWESGSGSFRVLAGYAYGVNALREDGHGAHNLGFLMQYDFSRGPLGELPGARQIRSAFGRLNPTSWRGFNGLFRR